MRMQRSNGSRMFLTELMFSILFFVIIVAVCVELLSMARKNSIAASELTNAVNAASNCAEYFISWDGRKASWQNQFEGSDVTDEGFANYFDVNFDACSAFEAVYVVSGSFEKTSDYITTTIIVRSVDDDRQIYSLDVEKAVFLED